MAKKMTENQRLYNQQVKRIRNIVKITMSNLNYRKPHRELQNPILPD